MEKYVSLTKHFEYLDIHFHFIDSLRFMISSLDKLTSYLTSYDITRRQFQDLSDEKFKLLTRKEVFPYEYIDSWEKLKKRYLPPKGKFFSTLHRNGISEEEYSHALHVCP